MQTVGIQQARNPAIPVIDQERIFEIWHKSPRFPTLPDNLREIIQLSFMKKKDQKPGSLIFSLIQQQRDQLLAVLNCPLFNLKKPVKTAREILNNAGPEVVRNLLLAQWLQDLKPSGKFEKINYHHWHRTNLVAGIIARHLARQFSSQHPEQLFILAYLQDISLLMLSRTFPEIYATLAGMDVKNRFTPAEEHKFLGTTHGQLSARILSEWGFPQGFLQPIEFHHPQTRNTRPESESPTTAQFIHFAQTCARLILGQTENFEYPQLERLFQEYFRQSPQELQQLMIELLRLIIETAAPLGFDDLQNVSLLRLLKNNPDFTKSKLLSYEELLEEALKAEARADALEREVFNLRNRMDNSQLRDSITGLYNLVYMQEIVNQQIREAARYQHPVSMVLLDIDQFGLFNKTYGFLTGNDLLVQIGKLLRENLRNADVIARYGADEFALVLPHTGVPHGRFVGEKLRKLIAATDFLDKAIDRVHRITVSVGVSSLVPSVAIQQADRLVQNAVDALGLAKKEGGNCCRQFFD